MKSFFFAPESPRLTALIRLALGFVLLCDAALHWRFAVELYSTYGPAIPIFVRQVIDESFENNGETDRKSSPPRVETVWHAPIPGPRLAVVAHTALLFALGSVVLGWHTRLCLVVALVFSLWLGPLDLPDTFAKCSVIAVHFIVLLVFSRCSAAWSLDAFFDPKSAERCVLASAAPRRLMQFFVCSIYLGAAVTKLKIPAFANGDLLSFTLLDYQFGSGPFGIWLSTLPHVPLLLSLATLLFEIMFPFLIWVPRCRILLLGLAFAVHTAMGLTLKLGVFSPVIFAALLSFVEEKDLMALGRILTRAAPGRIAHFLSLWERARVRARLPISAAIGAGVHLSLAALFVAGGYVVQSTCDRYGAFGRRPLKALEEVPAEMVAEMLAQRSPAYEDYFHRIELGNRFGGNQLFGSSRKFRIGQRAYVLAQLIHPRPPIELEGLLIAPDGREAARFTHSIDPSLDYSINGFELTRELPPGMYRIILQAEGFVIAEWRFELQGESRR